MSGTKEVFLEAINRLEKYGWQQEAFGSEQSGYCMFGAIWSAGNYLGISEEKLAVERELVTYLKKIDPTIGGRCDAAYVIGSWNDKPERTKDEVIGVLMHLAGVDRDVETKR